MANRVLRDHSQPCEHGEPRGHLIRPFDGPDEHWCPGGRDITIDYEAAKKAAEGYELPMSAITGIVVAAIGDGE